MSTVYWTPHLNSFIPDPIHPLYNNIRGLLLLQQELEPFLKYLVEVRGKDDSFITCPAFLEFNKNMFVLRSPVDLTVTMINNKPVFESSQKIVQDAFHLSHINRAKEQPPGALPLLSLIPSYLMYSTDDVVIELHELYFPKPNKNFNLVPGSFNIGKWIRPLDWTFEIIDPSKPVIIKQGDPLVQVRFITKDGSKVNFERVNEDEDILSMYRACVTVKHFKPKLSLESAYKLGESFIGWFHKKHHPPQNKSKCPFKKIFKKD